MTIPDTFFRKRLVNGYIDPRWFWEHSDLHPGHLSNIQEIFCLDKDIPEKDFHVLDMWSLHPNVSIVQGIWRLRENQNYSELPAICLSVLGKAPINLPYMVFSGDSAEGSTPDLWWKHPVHRGWSPLKWWFANREEDARLFTMLCARHLTERDWHLAGMPWAVIDYSVLCNLLQLSQPHRKNLPDQAMYTHYAF